MVKKEKHFLLLAMHCDISDIFLHDILHHTGRVTLEDVAHISARCLCHFLYRVTVKDLSDILARCLFYFLNCNNRWKSFCFFKSNALYFQHRR